MNMQPLELVTKFAVNACNGLCTENGTGLTNVTAGPGKVQAAMTIIFGILGAAALIYIIIGGIGFVTSQGDPQGVSRARQTVIYAVIGLVVAISAEAIINFVLFKL